MAIKIVGNFVAADNAKCLTDWRLYAAAGAAALAAGSAADASIIYTDPAVKPQVRSAMTSFNIGGERVQLAAYTTRSFSGVRAFMIINSGNVARFFDDGFSAHDYKLNDPIGAHGMTVANHFSGLLRFARWSGGSKVGEFLTNKTGIAGFKLADGDLGWVRVEVQSNSAFPNTPDAAEVINWAYNDVPGAAIDAGQTAVPEPSALGLLAMGSAGVLAWRRRRAAVVRPE